MIGVYRVAPRVVYVIRLNAQTYQLGLEELPQRVDPQHVRVSGQNYPCLFHEPEDDLEYWLFAYAPGHPQPLVTNQGESSLSSSGADSWSEFPQPEPSGKKAQIAHGLATNGSVIIMIFPLVILA